MNFWDYARVSKVSQRSLLYFCVGLFGASAIAEPRTFSARVGEDVYTCTVEETSVGGLASVSLKEVVRQLGGQVRVESGAVRVTLLGATANIVLGDTRIASTHNEFTIQHPAREFENDIFIAVSDVAPLFNYGFKLNLQRGDAALAPPVTPGQPTVAPSSVAGRKLIVVIDAGHGGTDPGESGPAGAEERTISLAIALRVAELLKEVCTPVLTRSQDQGISTRERVGAANVTLRGDVLVSIHTGASSSPVPSGFEVFCLPPPTAQDPRLQMMVQRSLALGQSIANAMTGATGTPARGVHQVPALIFSSLQMPGVIVETGFITNPTEEALLVNAEYQEKLAQGIANGVVAYVKGMTQ
ncbi:MAG TPA: N-acetylmuramoyl-L-alanine amidase [Candidatus Hydrogenedentes bacterium]|nr:N-acetylmuramoyl-L-alanine amidase [Candidatus Hydrogenedentota bacterium]